MFIFKQMSTLKQYWVIDIESTYFFQYCFNVVLSTLKQSWLTCVGSTFIFNQISTMKQHWLIDFESTWFYRRCLNVALHVETTSINIRRFNFHFQPNNIDVFAGKELHLIFFGTTQLAKNFAYVIKKIWINEGCSEPEHPLCSSSSADVMPDTAAHTFRSESTSNNSKTRNMREPVSFTTVTIKDDSKTKLEDIRMTNLNRIPHQYKFY